MTAAISAAAASLASTTIISALNNGGDIGKVLDKIGSSEYAKLAISVVTAGATAGAGEALNLGHTAGAGTAANPTGSLTSSSLKIGQHAKQIAVNSTIGAGVVLTKTGYTIFKESGVAGLKAAAINSTKDLGSGLTALFNKGLPKIDDLIKSANKIDSSDKAGNLTKVGRSLAKKTEGRGSTAFPKATGSPANKNELGSKVLNDILNDHRIVITKGSSQRYGEFMDFTSSKGLTARYSKDGKTFIGFREPN
jgi:hypothetical protein